MKAELIRGKSDAKQTLGDLRLFDDDCNVVYTCKTLELPWLDNAVQKSCIPAGSYNVVPRTSAKFKKHFHVLDVPGRSYILFHSGNYHTQILGCVLVGTGLSYINKDGYLDVTSSKVALGELLKRAPDGFKLDILWHQEP